MAATRVVGVTEVLARHCDLGAVPQHGGVRFRVRTEGVREVVLELEGERIMLERDDDGCFAAFVPAVGAGARYAYRLDGSEALPDPVSRFQPDGPHGRSMVVDPAFAWTDADWPGPAAARHVLYELHVGTFTPAGTWRAATAQLDELAALGITAVELMPIAEFAGRFGWGYDGVLLFAPYHHYGTPDDARAFVDRAHALGIGVVLDVVYNHLGPDGNYLPHYLPRFFSSRRTEWGEALNFDGPGSEAVREHVLANVAYWIDEFHMDGLRLDATQSIFDDGPAPIVREIVRSARAAAGGRHVFVSGENEPQDPVLLRPESRGGCGLDALWNDDFHHSARVALTGRSEAYYTDYTGSPQELVSAVTRGWLYQGQRYSWQDQRRGAPARDVEPRRLVSYLQNHDQVANSLRGERLHAESDAASVRALTALLLLGPSHVLLFQGQEYGAPQPFLYFADHGGELGEAVRSGRHEFLRQFESIAAQGDEVVLDDPRAPATFERCRLDPADRRRGAHWLALHRDLIRLAREDAVIAEARAPEGAVMGSHAFALRWHASDGGRLLIVNLGNRMVRRSIAEPLLAPPNCSAWQLRWSSEDPRYGGRGTPAVETVHGWNIPARAAVLLAPGADAGLERAADEHARREDEKE